ncbi:MAG: type II toxin-antitoxin system VapC family toxin [Phycicoccus sp.]
MMLLDTHVAIELVLGGDRLGDRLLEDVVRGPVLLSAVSTWEVTIKRRLGKLALPATWADEVWASGVRGLPLLAEHTLRIGEVDLPHADPFDRALVTQALVEGVPFVTGDRQILAAGLPFVRDARA